MPKGKEADGIGKREKFLARLDSIIVNALFAVAFFLALSPVFTTVFLMIGAAAWLIKLGLTKGSCFRAAPFDKLILLFVFLSFCSVFVSPDKGFSFYNYYNLVGRYILLYYLVVQNIQTLRELKLLVFSLALSAAGVVFYGYYQYIFGIDVTNMLWVDGEKFPELKKRVFSTLQNPNILAGYLTVMMFLGFGVWVKAKRKLAGICLGAAFILLAVCLAMTYCRGAWLSVILILAVYALLKNKLILLPMALAAAGAAFFDPGLAERFLSAFSAGDTSSHMRLGIWESTVAMILDHPFLGIGWGAYWMVYPVYDFYIRDNTVLIVHAHNMYLNFAAEIGVFGALVFFIIFFKHMVLAFTSVCLRQSDLLNGVTMGCALSLAAIALNGLTDYVLFNTELSMLYWLICAVIVLICRRSLD